MAEATRHLQAAVEIASDARGGASNLQRVRRASESPGGATHVAELLQPRQRSRSSRNRVSARQPLAAKAGLPQRLDAMLAPWPGRQMIARPWSSAGQVLQQLGRPVEACEAAETGVRSRIPLGPRAQRSGKRSLRIWATPTRSIDYYCIAAVEADPSFVVAYHNLGACSTIKAGWTKLAVSQPVLKDPQRQHWYVSLWPRRLPPVYAARRTATASHVAGTKRRAS